MPQEDEMSEPKTPKRIYLQTEDFLGEDLEDDITWCADRINDTDVLYIRADIVDAALAKAKAALAGVTP